MTTEVIATNRPGQKCRIRLVTNSGVTATFELPERVSPGETIEDFWGLVLGAIEKVAGRQEMEMTGRAIMAALSEAKEAA